MVHITLGGREVGRSENLRMVHIALGGQECLIWLFGLYSLSYRFFYGEQSFNHLTDLPASLAECSRLEKLWANDNQISRLPLRLGHELDFDEMHLR